MKTKEFLLEVAEKLPPDAMLVDAIYELDKLNHIRERVCAAICQRRAD